MVVWEGHDGADSTTANGAMAVSASVVHNNVGNERMPS
eukprot:COSAG05_NODE_193_length_14574_cov_23.070812_12_plen_38_part_00